MKQSNEDHLRAQPVETRSREENVESVQRPPWRAPRLERLRLSLDTANAPGSGADGTKATTIF